MENYELVLLLDSKTKESERNDLITAFEKNFKDNIVLKDEMGLLSLLYPLN
jgi:ribosomal protein S6